MLDQPVQRQPVADQLQIQGLGDHGGNEIRIPYRRQRDEIHAVGKLVERLRRNLEAQPRLADAAGAGQRQQALAFQQLFGLQDRVGAADEAGQLGGQVVGRPVERAQGRELIRHAGHDQLEEAFSPCQVAQAMGAQVPQRELVWQAFHDQRFGALGNEDLAPVRGTGDPRRVMDVQADVLVAHQGRLARMKADPDPYRGAVGPGMLGKGALRAGRGLASVHRAREYTEERISFGAELPSLVAPKCISQHLVMDHLQLHVLFAELLHQPRRPLDVGEEEGHGAGRKGQLRGRDSEGLKSGSSAAAIAERCSSRSKSRSG